MTRVNRKSKLQMLGIFLGTIFLLAQAASASAADGVGGDTGGKNQTPVQVAIQIVGTAIILKVLEPFVL